jgi:hypothetical protein
MVIQKRNKARDGPLEVDIVLPQRVVGIDEEGLGVQALGSWLLALGSWLLAFSSTLDPTGKKLGQRMRGKQMRSCTKSLE